MTKRLHIILSFIFAVVIAVSALVFPTSIPLASAAETVVGAYDEQNIMQDLEGSTVGGKPFDVQDYPRNTFGHPQIIHFVEFCYSYDADKQSDFGLYVYVYNPQQVAIDTDTERNKIEISYGNKAGKEYSKYVLEFLNYSTETGLEGRFYKFKLRLSDAAKQSILNNVNEDERIYEVVGIELSVHGKVEDYTCAQKYTYTGFAKGYGSELAEGDTVSAQVDGLEEFVELDVEHTFYRTKTSSKGVGYQNQLNTVYFAVPKRIFEEFGKLQRIKAEWYEYKTKDVVVTSNEAFYNAALPYIGKPSNEEQFAGKPLYNKDIGYGIAENAQYLGKPIGYEADWGWNGSGSLPGSPFWSEISQSHLYYLFLTDEIEEYDPSSDLVSSGGVMSSVLESYIRNYDLSFENGSLDCKDDTISADLFEDDIDEYRKVDSSYGKIQKGYSYYDFDADVDLQTLSSWSDSDPSFWENWENYGFWDALIGNIPEEESRTVSPIVTLTADDLEGSDLEVSERLLIRKSDVPDLRLYYADATTSVGLNDEEKIVVLFRFATSDYYSSPLTIFKYDGKVMELPKLYEEEAYRAWESVFFDFDVIQLSFTKGNSVTAIPVVASPIDIVNDITTPSHIPDDGWLKYVLAVIALIIVLIILAPLLPYVFKFLVWLLMLPAKLVVWIINLFKRKNE